MNKQVSIALHLAQKMGFKSIQTAPPQYQVDERVTHEVTDIRREIFNPHTDRAQWADVLLWAVTQGINVDMYPNESFVVFEKSYSLNHDKTTSGIISTSLECIALTTGWVPTDGIDAD
jgi:hypothetical protein